MFCFALFFFLAYFIFAFYNQKVLGTNMTHDMTHDEKTNDTHDV